MKTQFKYSYALIILLTMYSCRGDDQVQQSNQNETRETNELEVDKSELEGVSLENLDNGTFKMYLAEKPGLLIDVRTAEEFSEGHIDGAINLDFNNGQFEASLDTLNHVSPIFVYCQGGRRSGQARDLLKEKDFLEIYNLKNGYGSWKE